MPRGWAFGWATPRRRYGLHAKRSNHERLPDVRSAPHRPSELAEVAKEPDMRRIILGIGSLILIGSPILGGCGRTGDGPDEASAGSLVADRKRHGAGKRGSARDISVGGGYLKKKN